MQRKWLCLLLSCFVLGLIVQSCSSLEEKKTYKIGKGFQGLLDSGDIENRVSAFSEDLFFEISNQTGHRFNFIKYLPNSLFFELDHRHVDAILTTVSPDSSGFKKYIFSEPFFLFGPVLVIRDDSTYQKLDDLIDRSVGIQSGYSTTFTMNQYPNTLIRSYQSMQQAVQDLLSGTIDGLVINAIPAYQLAHGLYKGRLKVATPCLTDEGIRLVGERGLADDLIQLFNQQLEEMREHGTYQELIRYWNLFDGQDPGNQ